MSMYEFTVAHRDENLEAPRDKLGELMASAQLEPVSVANVLRHLQASAKPERGISLTIEVDESLYVNADEEQLAVAVGNLLHDAIQSCAPGAHVVMRSRAEDEGVLIEVDDERGPALSLVFPPAWPRISSWPPAG